MLYYKRGSSIVSVQFIPKSRWIIVMDSQETRDRLAGMEIVFESHCVLLRRYDDVMRTDYKQYLRRIGLLELINNGKWPEMINSGTMCTCIVCSDPEMINSGIYSDPEMINSGTMYIYIVTRK